MSVASTAEKVAETLLWPGTKICQLFGIEPTDDAGLIRSMFNMLVYLCVMLPIVWLLVL